MSAQIKKVHVRNFVESEIPTTLGDLINALILARDEVPHEYWDKTKVYHTPETDCEGGSSTSMEIYYDRPMTPEEIEDERLWGVAEKLAKAAGWRAARPWSEVPPEYYEQAKAVRHDL